MSRKVNARNAWDYYERIWSDMDMERKEWAIMWVQQFHTYLRSFTHAPKEHMLEGFELYKKYVDSTAVYETGCNTCYSQTYYFMKQLIEYAAAQGKG